LNTAAWKDNAKYSISGSEVITKIGRKYCHGLLSDVEDEEDEEEESEEAEEGG
jgi:hypothetical protein